MFKVPPTDPEERRIDVCRAILEKKSCINLAEGFGVSLKHCEFNSTETEADNGLSFEIQLRRWKPVASGR